MVVASPLNLRRVTASVGDSQKKVTEARSTVKNIGQVILKRTKVKREAFTQTNLFRKRREESERRMLLEEELEAPRVVTTPKGPQQLVEKTGAKGFFDRILGFIGYLAAGWLMNNLPTWIAMGKEFIARIQKAGEIVSGFFNNTVKLFVNVGNILGALGQNLLQFDFFDTSNRVKNSMSELNTTMGNLTSQIEEAYGLLTTPLTQGKYSGEEIPETGTRQTDEGAYATPPPYTGEETTAGGKVVNPQAVYAYLRQLGVPHIHAVGIVANIKGESGFRIDADETGRGTGGIGLFQYTFPSRKQAFLRAVPDYKTNWKGQVKYAITQDPNTPIYLRKQFSTPEQAADDFMINWERPAKRVYAGRRKKHNDFIKSFKPGQGQQPLRQATNQASLPALPPTDTLGGGVQRYGASRDKGARRHAGTDFDIRGNEKFFSRIGGVVTKVSYQRGGYGNYIDIYNSQLGVYERIAEGARVLVKRGQSVQPGQPVVQGESSTGVIHYEIRKNSGYGFAGTLDPIAFLRSSSTQQQVASSPAQMSAPPQQSQTVPSALTPERRGQDIVIIDQPRQQQNIITPAASSGGAAPSPISDFDLLNNFIKNKLLLDLAYL
jgi:murein DD-endopeptidase MepM/ murein hydrolase activator NlpD